MVLKTFTDRDWIENFRISKATFEYLCNEIRPHIRRQNTRFRECVSEEHRLAITLWCLATTSEYRTIGHLFGVARSTVCVIVHDTCEVIVKVLLKRYIHFPTDANDLQELVRGFKSKWGIIQCAGSIDGCHIPVLPPANNHTDYYNRKGWYSVILQGVVDHEYRFRDIYVGWPGSVHDARVLAHSSFYRKAISKEILNGDSITVENETVPVFVVGDSAYPLSTWLMKPFAQNTALSPQEIQFNYRISKARIVVENAFGRLKARWRRLMKRNDMKIENVPSVITTCCILHNLCEIHGEAFNDVWMEGIDTTNCPPSPPCRQVINNEAKTIQRVLVSYFANEN